MYRMGVRFGNHLDIFLLETEAHYQIRRQQKPIGVVLSYQIHSV